MVKLVTGVENFGLLYRSARPTITKCTLAILVGYTHLGVDPPRDGQPHQLQLRGDPPAAEHGAAELGAADAALQVQGVDLEGGGVGMGKEEG